MNKADRKRVDELKREQIAEKHHPDCGCSICFFLSIIDKQDKVVEVAQDLDTWHQAGGTPEELEAILWDIHERNHKALKELEGKE